MTPELQPVIFAAGEGSKMFPLTEEMSKCMLPVGNHPMIWYVVNYLQQYGFKEITVIVRSGDEQKVSQCLHSSFENLKFDFVKLPDDDNEDFGTADSLRLLKNKIKKDVLILSCDMFTDAPLNQMVDIHRTYDASLTVMLSKRVEIQTEKDPKQSSKTKNKDPNSGMRDFVSIDSKEKRLLYFANEGDLEQDAVSIKKSCLKKYPHMKLNTELVDCHLYIMKKWLIEYLTNYTKPESIKSDFIPHIVQKQFSKRKVQKNTPDVSFLNEDEEQTERNKQDIFSYVKLDELTEYMQEWSGYQGHCLKDQIKCHAYVTDSFCLRVNTLPTYTHINRQITKMKETLAPSLDFKSIHSSVTQNGKSQIGNDCLVGQSTVLNNNVTIKKSSIGKHCVIGSNIRISNCIIMDHVTIKDGCIIQGSIVCDNSTLQENVKLTSCQVSSGQTITENSKLISERMCDVLQEKGTSQDVEVKYQLI